MSSRPELKLDWCTHEAAKYACEHWHYSKVVPKSKLVKVGVWESGQFVGVIIFGVGATSALVHKYGLKMEQGCELVRIAMRKHTAEVSRCVSIALRMLKRQCPGIRLVVSFADPEQGHVGGVYKAGGWLYAGKTNASDEYIYKGKRWQGRSFRNRFGGMEKSKEVQIIKGSSKHRYLMPLDEEMRDRITPLAKPYPKRAGSAAGGTPGIQPGGGGSTPTPAL